ncbi:hypothetical protein VNO78_20916 [Psophocarpus tetragonolobus]|uniref:Uncharacterized protein n=1 Tax=Psophocarpus tetragonolobus TaxID=3891 RepID=A0AAN9SAP2_PSOTE
MLFHPHLLPISFAPLFLILVALSIVQLPAQSQFQTCPRYETNLYLGPDFDLTQRAMEEGVLVLFSGKESNVGISFHNIG